jgi:hypothetical protein
MNWLERSTSSRLRFMSDCRTFVIIADNPSDGHMPWWVAKSSDGKHVAAGYGDAGLAKCQLYCGRAAAARVMPEQIEPITTECQRGVMHAPNLPPAERAPQATLF